MYAIIKDRGHQYKVREGDRLRVLELPGEKGASVTFGEVLLVGQDGNVKVGTPTVKGAKVTAVLEGHARGEKTISNRRLFIHEHKVRRGHRTDYSVVKIAKIEG